MNTDSFIQERTTDDVYKDMNEDDDIYDTSNYDPHNPLFSNKNKKVVGKFKDELGEKILSEFVGVRSKAYAYKYLTRGLNEFKCEKKLKCLKKSLLKETMNFQHNLECIWKRKDVYREMNLIRNYKHKIFSETS